MPVGRSVAAGARDDEVVALGLAQDGGADRRLQRFVAIRTAQRGAQVGGILAAEAEIEPTDAGDADPIAAFAEIVGQRRDEAEPAAGLGDVVIARRAALYGWREDGALTPVVERSESWRTSKSASRS